jgi:hypothetical protein
VPADTSRDLSSSWNSIMSPIAVFEHTMLTFRKLISVFSKLGGRVSGLDNASRLNTRPSEV